MTERFLVSVDLKRLTTWYKYSYFWESHIFKLTMEGKGYLAGKLLEEWKPFMQSETVQTGNVKLSSSLGLPLEVRSIETV